MNRKLMRVISTREAAALTGLSSTYIRQLCRAGAIQAAKIGRDWTMSELAIKHLIKEHQPNGIGE